MSGSDSLTRTVRRLWLDVPLQKKRTTLRRTSWLPELMTLKYIMVLAQETLLLLHSAIKRQGSRELRFSAFEHPAFQGLRW
jgi:hypothetical protein